MMKRLPLVLGAVCIVLLAVSFLSPVQKLILAAGEMLKGSVLRRPEKWFFRIRFTLFVCAGVFAGLQLLIILIRRAWCPLFDVQEVFPLFMSDANLLAAIIAMAVSVFLTFLVKDRVGNMFFLLFQICFFATAYFMSCFCLLHNRYLKGKCRPAVQFVIVGVIIIWQVLNFIPSSAGSLWHASARMRFRYQMPLIIYLLFLSLVVLCACMVIRTASLRSKKIRLAASLVYTLILSSLFYVPNIFGDDPYHINAWEGSVFEVINLVPYSADRLSAFYGHYGIFYLFPMRFLHLFGIPYNIAIAAIQFLVAAIMFLAVIYVLNFFIKNDAVFFIFLIAIGSFFQFGGHAYFQQNPHRMVFGALVSACLLWIDRKGMLTRRRLVGLSLLGAASLLWNPETGLVCMFAISVWLFFSCSDFSEQHVLQKTVKPW